MPSEDLVVTPIDVKIPIGGKVDVQCSNPSSSNTSSQNQLPLITDSFVTLQLVSTLSKYLCDSDVTMTWIFQFQSKNYEAYFCEETKWQSDFKN